MVVVGWKVFLICSQIFSAFVGVLGESGERLSQVANQITF